MGTWTVIFSETYCAMTTSATQHLSLWLLLLCLCLSEVAAQGRTGNSVHVQKQNERHYRDSIQTLILSNGTISMSCYFSYPIGDSRIQPDFGNNSAELDKLHRFLHYALEDSLVCVRQVSLKGCGSVDGSYEVNQRLAHTRAYSFLSYMDSEYNLSKRYRVDVSSVPVDWDGLRKLIAASSYPWRASALGIIDSYANLDQRKVQLGKLDGGGPYLLMYGSFYPLLRRVEVEITYDVQCMQQKIEMAGLPHKTDSVAFFVPVFRQMEMKIPPRRLQTLKRPLFALKTNLLFDVAMLPNIELEVPIGNRFSLAAEVVFPWWLWEQEQHCLQVVNGNLEGRYWLGNREKRRNGSPRLVMTGWFTGLYAGGGYYDLEWDKRGYQGEFFIMGGVSGGYAHSIGRHLRMEYSVGVGYLKTNYRYYEARLNCEKERWELYRQNDGRFSWLGPTRAKVSLVWMLYTNRKPKGGDR